MSHALPPQPVRSCDSEHAWSPERESCFLPSKASRSPGMDGVGLTLNDKQGESTGGPCGYIASDPRASAPSLNNVTEIQISQTNSSTP
jgi:hypothetical protein